MKIFLSVVLPNLALHAKLTFLFLICSYFFIPSRNFDGQLLPILTVGWTLSYEMFFYLNYAISQKFSKNPHFLVSIVLVFISLLSLIYKSQNDQLGFFINPILIEFLLGMFIAKLYLSQYKIPPFVCIVLIIIGVIIISSFNFDSHMRIIFFGIPSMLVVAGTVFLEEKISKYIPNIFTKLGDSSYSLYLFHPFVIPTTATLFVKFGLINPTICILSSCILSLFMGYLIFKYIETPIFNFFKNVFVKI